VYKKTLGFGLGILITLALSTILNCPVSAKLELESSALTNQSQVKDDLILAAHTKKSNGNWKGKRDKHQGIQLGRKEIKRQAQKWIQRQGKKPNGNVAKRNSKRG